MFGRRRTAPPWVGRVALAALLCAPPAWRVAERLLALKSAEAPETIEALRNERDALKRELSAIASEAFLPTLNDPEGSWRTMRADVLPLSDPSPARSSLWVKCRGGRPAPRDSAVFSGTALLGRVVRAHGILALAQVQTLLDPAFRVRFSAAKGSGMLRGTGREAEDGFPLLEVLHLDAGSELAPGETVFTEGHDGVYPPGLVVGRVEPEPPSARGEARALVRAGARAADAFRVEIAIDARREAVGEIQGGNPPTRRKP